MDESLHKFLDALIDIWPPVAEMRHASIAFWEWREEDILSIVLYADIAKGLGTSISVIPDDIISNIALLVDAPIAAE